jgi:hypothetical protein
MGYPPREESKRWNGFQGQVGLDANQSRDGWEDSLFLGVGAAHGLQEFSGLEAASFLEILAFVGNHERLGIVVPES